MYNKIEIKGVNMRRVKCPICAKPFMLVSDDIYIDFDIREADKKEFCENCKRKIRFSEKKRVSKSDTAERSV
jgi:C4-type Zn-finger protein